MKECSICGSTNLVQNHHIVHGRGKRKQCETPQDQIDLCWEHHYGTFGVHGREGHALDMKLKLDLQLVYFELGYTNEKTRELMGGRLYFEEEEGLWK